MVFAGTAARKLLHGGGDAVGVSFGLDGLWQLIVGLFANLLAALGGAAHLLVLPFEALWHGRQTAAAAATGISSCFDGLWHLTQGFFASLLAELGSAAHLLVLPVEELWRLLQTAAAGISLGFHGLAHLIQRFFANPLATAAHELLPHFEKLWRWLQNAASVALPVVLGLAALLCLVALVWFCWQWCVGVTMRAPGAGGMVISRAAFLADPRLYFQILHSAGGTVASAIFSTTTVASALAAPVAALFRA